MSCPESAERQWMTPKPEQGPPTQDKRQVWSKELGLGLTSLRCPWGKLGDARRCSVGWSTLQISKVGGASGGMNGRAVWTQAFARPGAPQSKKFEAH